MKKNILFVCASLKVGGAEKSLVNLLNMIDYTKYSIDLLLFQKQGEFLKQIPNEVHLVECGKRMQALYDNVSNSPQNVCIKIYKYITTVVERLQHSAYDELRAYRWTRFYKRVCEPLKKHYDVAVAFQSGEPSYFVMDKVNADRKVSYFHTDISNIRLAYKVENKYLNKFDLIVTISEKCLESLNDEFPQYHDKMIWLQNLSSAESIRKLAGSSAPVEYKTYGNQLKIVSVGRLESVKGYDFAIDAAYILKKHNISFQWFVVGEGTERKELEKQIKQKVLKDCFHLLGLRSNPYPYIKFADILVQSSRYEGKSVVLDEAKILDKPIVVTEYDSAKDQISDGVDGLIAKMNGKDIAEKIMNMLNSNLRDRHHICNDISDRKAVQDYMDILVEE